jgi:LPXTG-motif cell wall-anchored protein
VVDPCATPGVTTTSGVNAATTVPSGTGSGSAGSGGLPRTGADSAGLVGLGLALLAAGGAVVLTVRRSQRTA